MHKSYFKSYPVDNLGCLVWLGTAAVRKSKALNFSQNNF